MANVKKIIIGSTIGVALVGLVTYFSRLKRTSAELESVATAMIHSISLSGLTIRIDVQLKNPTSSSLKIKFPFVKVLFKEKVIGTSKLIDKDITIPKNGEARISSVMINVPATGLLSLGGGIVNLLLQKQPAPIFVKTVTTIDLGWKKIPYEKTDDSTLKPKA